MAMRRVQKLKREYPHPVNLKIAKPEWIAVDDYFGGLFAPKDKQLDAALVANRDAGLPAIDVSPLQGKFLHVLVQILKPKRVLEIGTLGGYSTMWMARALPREIGRASCRERV